MASLEKFEDHCWNDVVSAADLKLYSCYARATHVGPRPALLAIDLYNIVYRGGSQSPYELDPVDPNSCGIYAHEAVAPTKRLFSAARRAGHSHLLLHSGNQAEQPAVRCGLDLAPRPGDAARERRL